MKEEGVDAAVEVRQVSSSMDSPTSRMFREAFI